jgi:LAO/AO transport system kinase
VDPSIRHRLSQSLTSVENRTGNWRQLLAESYAKSHDLFIVGITGPPGCGKSTLIDGLAVHWAEQGRTIGVLAIDPSSPFSGGAILGDRLRMRRAEDLDKVVIRSMSARGHGGGVNVAALDLCMVMAAYGCSHVVLETVGSGQSEIDIGFIADCTIVIAVPGLGDSVQAAKAGILEIGDLYVVNKSDLPQAKSVQQDLAAMLAVSFRGRPGHNSAATPQHGRPRAAGAMPAALSERYGDPDADEAYWHPPVFAAAKDCPEHIAEIARAIDSFDRWLKTSGHFRTRRRVSFSNHVLSIARDRWLDQWTQNLVERLGQPLENWTREQLSNGTKDPYRLADVIVDLAGSGTCGGHRGGDI